MISSKTVVSNQTCGSAIKRHQHRHNVNSRYEFIKTLGKGTYGKVKLARHKETNQLVAVKSIRKDQVKDSVDMRHIRREMELMSSIRHQHIIQIYEVFENQDKIVIVMEYAAGGELYEYLASKSGITDDEARGFFRQIVSAVRYCHHQGIVHRDLKLENILLDKHNRIKIADFGLANSFKSDSFLHTFCGSPLYASPEIVCGVPYRGPEVDSWSLGVLLYALVYGTMPFDGRNYQLLTKQITSGVFTKPPRHSDAHNLICWMLTVDPRLRATINDVAVHRWVGLDALPKSNTSIPATLKPGTDLNDNTLDKKPLATSQALPAQNPTPKSILKQKATPVLPARPQSLPATPNMDESLADQLAAVCGFNTKDSLILKSSNAAAKRRMLRSKRDRESGYYSSPEQAQFFHDKVSASEPALTEIGEASIVRPAQVNTVRASWPNSSEHSSSLPSGMSTCGLIDARTKQRYTSVSSDDACSVGSVARPGSTYSDSSVLSSDSFDICTCDCTIAHTSSLPRPSTFGTPKGPNSRPLTLTLTPDNLPHPGAKDLEKQAPGSLTPKSEKLVRELERILAPSGRRRARPGIGGFEPLTKMQNSPQFLPVIADLNDNFECKKGIDSCTNITLAEV